MKPGFKQTEVGVIPEEWEVRSLPDLTWFQEGPGLRNWQFTSSGMKVINVTNLEGGILNLDRTDRYISLSEFHLMYKHFSVDAADIVMASSGNSYSKIAVVREQDLPLVMNTSVIRFKPLKTCDYRYLWVVLGSHLFKKQIDLAITGGAQPNFGPYHLNRIKVPVPPITEQSAIAEVLGDADALIESLERLIAKKRDVKQGAMQELLTGKRRLPGFTGKWEETSLGTLGKTYGGLTGKTKADFGAGTSHYIPFLNILNNVSIDIKQLDRVRLRQGEVQNSACKTDLFFNGSSETPEEVGLCSALLQDVGDLYLNSFCFGFRFNRGDEADSQYLAYFFRGGAGRKLLYALAQGATRHNLSKVALLAVKFRLPSISEQKAIAAVLSDMDAEISVLEAKLSKARAIKQGMMQELLTGSIRLK